MSSPLFRAKQNVSLDLVGWQASPPSTAWVFGAHVVLPEDCEANDFVLSLIFPRIDCTLFLFSHPGTLFQPENLDGQTSSEFGCHSFLAMVFLCRHLFPHFTVVVLCPSRPKDCSRTRLAQRAASTRQFFVAISYRSLICNYPTLTSQSNPDLPSKYRNENYTDSLKIFWSFLAHWRRSFLIFGSRSYEILLLMRAGLSWIRPDFGQSKIPRISATLSARLWIVWTCSKLTRLWR